MRNARSTIRAVGTALLLLAASGWSGCRTTVHTVEMERVDQTLAGNGGYLLGQSQPKAARQGTREIAELQVELPNRAAAPRRRAGAMMPPSTAVEPSTAQASATEAAPELYTVKKGDTLWGIARKMYGKGSHWQRIYEVNRDKLPEPGRLRAGMQLHIPREANEPAGAPGAYEK